jgi:ribosome-associated translation inhibitor RaiA
MADGKIQFIGFRELEDVDKDMLMKIINEQFPKIKRKLHNDTSLVVHIKPYGKGGARQKYSFHMRAIAPTRIFETSHATAWDLATAVHKAFEELDHQIEHAFKQEHGIKRNPKSAIAEAKADLKPLRTKKKARKVLGR